MRLSLLESPGLYLRCALTPMLLFLHAIQRPPAALNTSTGHPLIPATGRHRSRVARAHGLNTVVLEAPSNQNKHGEYSRARKEHA